MKALMLGVIQDLRERRMLPVAILLAAALVGVPVFMLKPAEEAPAPVAVAPITAPAGAEGLPTPEQALKGSDKPLVTLAALEQPSNLASFKSKDPFKPLKKLSDGLPSTDGSALAAATDEGAQSGGGGTTDGGSTGGGTSPTAPEVPDTTPTQPTDPVSPEQQQKFTYTLDATLDGPNGLRRFRNMPRLRMLPSENDPLLVFLGVDAAGEKAVFLVDSTVTILEGEGTCSPSRNSCATLSMEPGERQAFSDGDGQRYTLQIDQIRERSLASLAKAARAARKRKRLVAKTSVGYTPKRRFTPPVLAEILTGVQQ
jgi:hypothetical protein